MKKINFDTLEWQEYFKGKSPEEIEKIKKLFEEKKEINDGRPVETLKDLFKPYSHTSKLVSKEKTEIKREMGLIECPACGKEISDQAISCPSCGHPIKAITIEATGKKWKEIQILSFLIMIFGFFFLFLGISANSPGMIWIGVSMIIGGLIGYLRGRFGAWWYHG